MPAPAPIRTVPPMSFTPPSLPDPTGGAVGDALDAVVSTVTDQGQAATQAAAGATEAVIDSFPPDAGGNIAGMGDVVGAANSMARGDLAGASDRLGAAAGQTQGVVGDVADMGRVGEVVSDVRDAWLDAGMANVAVVHGDVPGAVGHLGDAVGHMADAAGGVADAASDAYRTVVGGAVGAVTVVSEQPGAVGHLGGAVLDVREAASDVAKADVAVVHGDVPGAVGHLGDAAGHMADAAGEVTGVALGTVAVTAPGMGAAAAAVSDHPRAPEVRIDAEFDLDGPDIVNGEWDGTESVDGRLGVEVGDRRVGVEFDSDREFDNGEVGDRSFGAGVFVDDGVRRTEVGGGTARTTDGDDVTTTTRGVFVERDGHRTEVGMYDEEDIDSTWRGDSTASTGGGVYVDIDGETGRAGWTNDRGGPDDPAHLGVFVEDAEGDQTGAGIILPMTATTTNVEVGTGGVYVDIDGEHHDAYAQGGVVADGAVSVTATIDPGPVGVSGEVGVQRPADGDPTGIVFTRGQVEVEELPDGDDLPHIDGLHDALDTSADFATSQVVTLAEAVVDPTVAAEAADSVFDLPEGGAPADAIDTGIVVVHDEVGDRVADPWADVDSGPSYDDPLTSESNDDSSDDFLDTVVDAVGDAAHDVGEAIGDLFS